MSYTVHITVPTPPGPGPGGRYLARWDDDSYADPEDALEVARTAYESRDWRQDVYVLNEDDGRTYDWFKAEPAPTHPLVGDDRPVHFTRTEVQRMIGQLTGWTSALPADVAEVHDQLIDRLRDTDRMLDAWDGTTPEDGER